MPQAQHQFLYSYTKSYFIMEKLQLAKFKCRNFYGASKIISFDEMFLVHANEINNHTIVSYLNVWAAD